jgi:hypothetical protein
LSIRPLHGGVGCLKGTVQGLLCCREVGGLCCKSFLGRRQLLHELMQALHCLLRSLDVSFLCYQRVRRRVHCLQMSREAKLLKTIGR